MEYKDIEISWLHHDCFRIKGGHLVVYTDPYKVSKEYNDADLILITHDHYDHLEQASIKKLVKQDTMLIAPKDCEAQLSEFNNEKVFVSPGEFKEVKGVSIRTLPSYNINKFKEGSEVFHPKGKGNVGYVFIVDGVKIYIAGDTDRIPEMKNIKTDIALLPVSGIYVMTAEEAAQAAEDMKTDIVIPMHYGSGIGTLEDAKKFKDLLEGKIKVEILPSIE